MTQINICPLDEVLPLINALDYEEWSNSTLSLNLYVLNGCGKLDQRIPSGARVCCKETYAALDCAAGWRYYTWASGDIYH